MLTGYLLGLVLLMSFYLLAREVLPVGPFVIAAALGESGATLGASLPPSFSITGALSSASSSPEQKAASFFSSEGTTVVSYSAEELCDELLRHMLDCYLCLTRKEHTCSAYQSLHQWIALQGGPQKGVVFALYCHSISRLASLLFRSGE